MRHSTNSPPLVVPVGDTAGIDGRPSVAIQVSQTAIDPGAIVGAFSRLHARLADGTRGGLSGAARGSAQTPIVEFQVAADGRPDPSLQWLVHSQRPAVQEDLKGILRTGLPNTYEFTDVDWHPRLIEEALPPARSAHAVVHNDTHVETGVVPYVAGVEYYATTDRKRDWRTGLASFHGRAGERAGAGRKERPAESHHVPLGGVVETMVQAGLPVLFQVVLHPYRDWTRSGDRYVRQLSNGAVSTMDRALEFLSPRDTGERSAYTPNPADQRRIESITSRHPARSFVVSARAVVLTRDDPERADAVARSLASALRGLDGPFHTVRGRVASDGDPRWLDHLRPGLHVYRELIDGHRQPVGYEARRRNLPLRTRFSTGIVADAAEIPGFCVVDGAGLTLDGQRGLAARRRERTAPALPPAHKLARYTRPGMALCMPLTHDRQPYGHPLVLPPNLQDRHVVVAGETGAGKSVLLERAMLTNTQATDGPGILFDYKGGGTAQDYLRAHHDAHGTLEDVHYFDLSRTLPALSFFDISPLLEAGVPREEARSRKAGHYEELLAGLMGPEQYGKAAESVKAVRNHLLALFDPVHGADAVAHEDLYAALRRTQREEDPPATADDRLAAYFDTLCRNDRDVFNAILGGAVGRVETIATDGRLAPVFDHVPESDDPHLAFGDLLDEDATVVFDFAGLESSVKRALTIVILSNLWTALKARDRSEADDTPLVNLYLEEARDIAATQLLDTLLAEGRSFGLSITLGLQYPEQLDSPEPERNTYQELLNETATFVAGPVAVDTDLPRVLATDARGPTDVARQLNALGPGEWVVRPGAPFGDEPVAPFLARSLPPPSGHPASDDRRSGDAEERFETAFEECRQRTIDSVGLEHRPIKRTAETEIDPDLRVDSLLPHTDQLPDRVVYHAGRHALQCEGCESRYAATIDGMRDALRCCGSLAAVDRDAVPVCRLELKRSPAEIGSSEWSLTQLCFLQAVYNAQQRRYDHLEYDLVRDSMRLLKDYVGIDNDAVDDLIEAGLLRHDTDHPHLLYTVTADGRDAIGESHREGIDFGHGEGDLWESTAHVLGVELGERLLERDHVPETDSSVDHVHPYHDLQRAALPESVAEEERHADSAVAEWRRLDIAGLDEHDEVAVAIEVERINNDVRRSVPADYDKLAACDSDEAIWIVPTRAAGREVFAALRDPLDGDPRIGRFHPRLNTPPDDHDRAKPGMSAIYTYAWLQERLLAG